MQEFIHLFNGPTKRLTDDEIDGVISGFEVNDERSERISLLEAFLFQLHAHEYVASREVRGKPVNDYNFFADGTTGIYPKAGKNSMLIDPDGRFRLVDGRLPKMEATNLEITPDEHRGNENRLLSAWHLTVARLHNFCMDQHGEYEKAVDEVTCALNNCYLNAAKDETGIEDTSEFFDVFSSDMHLSLEFAFSIGRWGHVRMPETFGGKKLFDKRNSSDEVPMLAMADEKAGKLGLRVAPSMVAGSEGGKGRSILDHTVKQRHLKHFLVNFNELDRRYRPLSRNQPRVPIWVGMMMEAENDRLGPLGARLVADGIAGTLSWGRDIQKGLWYDRPDYCPSNVKELIERVWS